MEKFKIVSDSSCDFFEFEGVDFQSVPLKIITASREFVDNEKLDANEMTNFLAEYKGRSSSSCPNPQDWISAFGDAENIFCITISGSLSGCYNSAQIAKGIYEDRFPGRRVFVLDTLSTGPEMKLIIERVKKAYDDGASFDEICALSEEYSKTTGLFFILKSMQNLANNGRISKIAAKAAGLLGIRVLGKASDAGELMQLDKCRGEDAVISRAISRMKEEGYAFGKVRITHCMNESGAKKIKKLILGENENADIEIYPTGGICSFYAECGGIIIGFEKK
ncbi:MAG: DegV family protein, partial [Oscillospiraceae bacterium]|nr:DegV family protein [Oscillospiraceae bacterium]